MAANNDNVIWYKKPVKARVVRQADPMATISAGVITLNKAITVFQEGDKIILGVIKGRSKKIVIRAADDGDDYTPFKCTVTKKGECSVKCKSFIQDVLVGDLQLDLSEKKRQRYSVEPDSEQKSITISLR